MKFHGSAGATGEDIVESSLSFNGIYIQAFFKDEASSGMFLSITISWSLLYLLRLYAMWRQFKFKQRRQ